MKLEFMKMMQEEESKNSQTNTSPNASIKETENGNHPSTNASLKGTNGNNPSTELSSGNDDQTATASDLNTSQETTFRPANPNKFLNHFCTLPRRKFAEQRSSLRNDSTNNVMTISGSSESILEL
jgi:hypothetical protein